MSIVAKITASSLGALAILFATAPAHAQTNVLSDPVGFFKVPLAVGPNFLAAPLFRVQAYRGLVGGVAGSTVTFSGTPGFTNNQFGPDGTTGNNQFMAIVRNDAVPAGGTNITGDWWIITANTSNTVTLDPSQGPVSLIGVGDQIEIRHLTTIADLFGLGAATILNQDATGDQNKLTADVIRKVNGSALSTAISYLTAPAGGPGYYDGNTITDGSALTIEPDEPLLVYRLSGATNVVVLGQVQTTPLTHYLGSGPNAVSSVFPANSPLGTSGLTNAGWLQDATGDQNTLTTDLIRPVVGSSLSAPISLLGPGVSTSGLPTWYDGTTEDNNLPLVPAAGYLFYVKTGTGGRVWRQTVPFTP
ncbi:MAG: TIGR02597 family protein [Verrucomicrobia bacterium]|nr:TIGR02597 family protein [Verrucomicrobiota bacterium]